MPPRRVDDESQNSDYFSNMYLLFNAMPTDRLQSKQSIFANKGYLSLTTTTTQNLIESEDQTRPRRRRRRRINKRFEGD